MVNQMRRALVVLALLALAACGGGGGDDGGNSSKLFVVDSGNRAIGSMINPNPAPGAFAIDRIIMGPSTGLGTGGSPSVTNLPSLALDAAGDRIYVATQLNVLQWENAGVANGNQPRSRVITSTITEGTTTRGINFFKLFIDTTNNRLYAAEPSGDVQVYNGASVLSGSVTPNRSIKPDVGATSIISTFGVAVDLARDMLYVGVVPSGLPAFMVVYHNQASISPAPGTAVTPNRQLAFPGAGSFYLDTTNDRLYVAVSNVINVYDNASTLPTGTPSVSRSFQLGVAVTQKYIFVDVPNNRLYGVSDNVVFIIPNAATANGPGVTGTVAQVQVSGALFSAVATKP